MYFAKYVWMSRILKEVLTSPPLKDKSFSFLKMSCLFCCLKYEYFLAIQAYDWEHNLTEVCPNGITTKAIWLILAYRNRMSLKSIWIILKCRIKTYNQTKSCVLRIWCRLSGEVLTSPKKCGNWCFSQLCQSAFLWHIFKNYWL